MAQHDFLLALPGRVSEHMVAITAASGLEPYGKYLVGGLRTWSDHGVLAMILMIYLAGLITAMTLKRPRPLIALPEYRNPSVVG